MRNDCNTIWGVRYEKSIEMEKRRKRLFHIIVVLMLASSLCMYSIEHEAQPEVFDNAFSGIW